MKNLFVIRGVDGWGYPEVTIEGADGRWVEVALRRDLCVRFEIPVLSREGRLVTIPVEPTGELEFRCDGEEVGEVVRPAQH